MEKIKTLISNKEEVYRIKGVTEYNYTLFKSYVLGVLDYAYEDSTIKPFEFLNIVTYAKKRLDIFKEEVKHNA